MPGDTTSSDLQCSDCGKIFRRSQSLEVHLCEPRRRRLQRGERPVQIAFQAFLEFFRDLHGSSRLKTQQDFEQSPYYRAFVKFGHYAVNTRVIDPEAYLHWCVAARKKIDHWDRDSVYTEFLIDWLPRESMTTALARTLQWADAWSNNNQAPAQHCLRYGNANAICHAVSSGRISAWVIYNCDSGQQFLQDLDAAALAMIWSYIDADRWQHTFRQNLSDQMLCQQALAAAGW